MSRRSPATSPKQDAADRLIAEGRQAESEGRLREACDLFRAAVGVAPAYAKAHLNLAVGLEALGDVEGAVACFDAALARDARDPYANYNLGRLLYARGTVSRAEQLLKAAVELKNDFPEAQVLLSSVYESQGALAAAATCLEAALRARPHYAGAWYNYGLLLWRLGRQADAELALRRVLEIDAAFAASADSPDPWHLLGIISRERGQDEQAVDYISRSLKRNAANPAAHNDLGNLLRAAGRRDEARACFLRAIELRPDFAAAYACLGILYLDDDRQADALGCLQKALELDPDSAEIRWSLAMSQLPAVSDSPSALSGSRSAFADQLLRLDSWFDASRAAEGSQVVGRQTPFYLAYQEESNRDLLQRHGRLCVRLMTAWAQRERLPPPSPRRSETIRVGVISEHFCNHSVWNAIVKGWFEQLDRTQLSLTAFSLGAFEDQETRVAMAEASRFESGKRGLRQWADAVLREQPEVLIYPEVGMNQMTLALASLRLAPVQVAAWGHPETTGLPTIDYYLSAEDLEPPAARENYTEQLVTLPHLGCFYRGIPVAATRVDWRSYGVDPARPVLLCPGVPFKYAPHHDRVLVEICRRLGRCQLVFFTFRNSRLSDKLRARLQHAFADAGLRADDFLTFIPWQNSAEFHGLLSQGDVFLDTIGFSGFNTAMEAVQCALPIVTLEGRFLRGRLASGILKRMQLHELVAQSEEEYVALAVKAAQNPDYRDDVRRRMAAARHVLFEDLAPIRALEAFLRAATGRTSVATSAGRDVQGPG